MGKDVLDDGTSPFRYDVIVFDAEGLEEFEKFDEVEFDALGVSMCGRDYLLSM